MAEHGPYLFGPFSIADAMYAPVVWRLSSYNVAVPEDLQAYVQTLLRHPAMQEWRREALAEQERIGDEAALLARFGGARE